MTYMVMGPTDKSDKLVAVKGLTTDGTNWPLLVRSWLNIDWSWIGDIRDDRVGGVDEV